MRTAIVVVVLGALALAGAYQVVVAGCNPDEPYVVSKDKVTMLAAPCGPAGVAPEWWEIRIDDETSFNAPASPANTADQSFWVPLGDFYRLRPGNNKIEYRAFTHSFGGMLKAAAVDVVNLVYLPPTPTATPTPEVTPTPTPFVGQYSIVEIKEATD